MTEKNGHKPSVQPFGKNAVLADRERDEAIEMVANDAELEQRHDEAWEARGHLSRVTQFNHAVVIVGLPGHGKTTVARQEVLAHLKKYPTGIALVHDPNAQFRDMCRHYDDAHAWREAAQKAATAKTPFPRGASIGGDAVDVTRTAVELGKHHNAAGAVRVPIMLVYDESSLMGTSGSSYMGELDTQLLSNRRHWGIAPIYNVQKPTALTEGFYTMATNVYVFAQPSERRTRVLEEYLGLKEHALRGLVGAPKFTYVKWESGVGLV